MKIIRGDLEIELTDQELQDAYHEQRHKWDVEDISCGWVAGNVRDISEFWAGIVDQVSEDTLLLDQVAERYRKYIEDCISGDDEVECFKNACHYVIGNLKRK